VLIEWRAVRDGNGSGGLNEDTARTKRWLRPARRYAAIAGQLFRVATREQQHRHEQGYENEVVAIAHPSHHTDIQLVRSHLVERGLRGMFVRARRSIITA